MARTAGSGGKGVAGKRRKPETSGKDAPPAVKERDGATPESGRTPGPATVQAPAPGPTLAPSQPPEAVAAPHVTSAPQQAAAAGEGRSASGAMAEALARGSSGGTARKLAENIERIESLGQRLLAALSARPRPNPGIEAPGPDLYLSAANAWVKTLSQQPGRLLESQVDYWGETLKNYAAAAQQAVALGQGPTSEEDQPKDKRFSHPLWNSHPYFSFIKRQYLINARAMKDAAGSLHLSDDVARRRITWLTDQIVDMMAPTNFLATNPEALERAIQTEGESLVRGLENLVRDVERNGGDIVVSLTDPEAFVVGEDIGASAGSVVERTRLYELIQYKPATDQVHETPLLIFPPWINKFYILDLKPQNSLIKWLLEQGHTLFVVSWKNPDASYADVGMEDYVAAYLEAMDKVRDLTGQRQVNAVGYCIAGTTLSLTLALLKQRGDDRVKSATLFTTLTDFSDQGEFVSFLQDDFVTGIAEEIKRHGLLRAQLMSRTMSFLRPNDLVWGPAIRSYMMGEEPPAFDLLFWNGDSTNLPGKMAMQYLRGLCQQNAFATEGFDVMGHKLHLSDVSVPVCAIACETDHIAPWKDCWRGVAGMGSKDKTFILSESGHIAGIVNPPTKKKYGHYIGSSDFSAGHQAWKEAATFTPGTWWTHWAEWLAERAGGTVPARDPGPGLCPAPGTYVHEKGS